MNHSTKYKERSKLNTSTIWFEILSRNVNYSTQLEIKNSIISGKLKLADFFTARTVTDSSQMHVFLDIMFHL